jgi:hypothetical protein
MANFYSREHLYRRHHPLPIYCDRCGLIFKSRRELANHNREIPANGCEVRLKNGLMGITAEMKKRLQSDKKRRCDQADRWREIYHMLFPDEPIPSPCKLSCAPIPNVKRLRLTPQFKLDHDTHDALSPDQGDLLSSEDQNSPVPRQLIEFVRKTLDSSPQRLPHSRESLEAIIASVLHKYQLDNLSTSVLSSPSTIPDLNLDFDFGLTPRASAPIWTSSEAHIVTNIQNQNTNMFQTGNHCPDGLAWRPPVPPHALSSMRSNNLRTTFNDDYHDGASMTYTDPRSSDSGYSTNSLGGPGNYIGGFDSVENGGFSGRALNQDLQSNVYSRPLSTLGPSHAPTNITSQNMASFPVTDFSWDEFVDKSKFS